MTFVGVVVLAVQVTMGTNAPQFLANREPTDDGVHPPLRWSATENVAWKTDLPGLGWASPIVWGDRVYLTTCVSDGQVAEPRKGLYIEDVDANKYPKNTHDHQWKVYCLDLNSGELLWERVSHQGVPAKPYHIKNTLASETPCTDGERLYAFFGNVGLFCYDMDGKLLWTHRVEPRETRYAWGTSMSPIVHGERVYLPVDNEEDSELKALDKRTGEVIWKRRRDEKTNYSTPYLWDNPVRQEIVVSGINWAKSYDLDGNELWKIKGHSILAIPTPFERDGLLYITSGHVMWGDNRLFAVRPGAQGDISPIDDEPLNNYLAWFQKAGPYHPTPIIVDGQLYMLLDRGFMLSFDSKTGAPVYTKRRIPKGRAFTSSPWTYANTIFCLNEDGVTFGISPGDDCKVLFTNELADDDMSMATPVIVGDRLLIRTATRIYCIQDRSK